MTINQDNYEAIFFGMTECVCGGAVCVCSLMDEIDSEETTEECTCGGVGACYCDVIQAAESLTGAVRVALKEDRRSTVRGDRRGK